MTHVMKAAIRHTKDFVNQHSVAEARVREATSNDPWGAPQQLLIDIAESTFKRDELKEVMDMLFKRMNDSSKASAHGRKRARTQAHTDASAHEHGALGVEGLQDAGSDVGRSRWGRAKDP